LPVGRGVAESGPLYQRFPVVDACSRRGIPSDRVPKAAVVARSIALLATLWPTSGCVGSLYALRATSAAGKLEEARTLKAHELAEYEYWFAYEHLEKAAEEAAQAEYGDALEYANIADDYAARAIDLARQAQRGAGR
jgi:hypothetical protein